MSHFPAIPLRTAIYDRLTGNDGAGLEVETDVYVKGAVPTSASAPYVKLDDPRTTGENYIGGAPHFSVRMDIKVHTRYAPGRADADERERIANDVHASLSGTALQVEGHGTADLLNPQKTPTPAYEIQGMRAYDLTLRYDLTL